MKRFVPALLRFLGISLLFLIVFGLALICKWYEHRLEKERTRQTVTEILKERGR